MPYCIAPESVHYRGLWQQWSDRRNPITDTGPYRSTKRYSHIPCAPLAACASSAVAKIASYLQSNRKVSTIKFSSLTIYTYTLYLCATKMHAKHNYRGKKSLFICQHRLASVHKSWSLRSGHNHKNVICPVKSPNSTISIHRSPCAYSVSSRFSIIMCIQNDFEWRLWQKTCTNCTVHIMSGGNKQKKKKRKTWQLAEGPFSQMVRRMTI